MYYKNEKKNNKKGGRNTSMLYKQLLFQNKKNKKIRHISEQRTLEKYYQQTFGKIFQGRVLDINTTGARKQQIFHSDVSFFLRKLSRGANWFWNMNAITQRIGTVFWRYRLSRRNKWSFTKDLYMYVFTKDLIRSRTISFPFVY